MRRSFPDVPRCRLKTDRHGFTLIELVLVIVIIGILTAVAMRSGTQLVETGKAEETKRELDALAGAIIGNPDLYNTGAGADYGYVGDVGALPPNLDALYSNPGGYATWNGPYVHPSFEQSAADYKTDAWGSVYSYSGTTITSTGSGTNIVKQLATSTDHILRNSVAGMVLDRDGTPPGNTYRDSLSVRLSVPDGSGGVATKIRTPDMGGYFVFDSIPIGNHDLRIIYQPQPETLDLFVATGMHSRAYAVARLSGNYWGVSGSGGGLALVAASDTVYSSPQCNNFSLWVTNTDSVAVTISSLILTWSAPTAYYRTVIWEGTQVADSPNPAYGSGQTVTFSSSQVVAAGAQVKVQIETFKSNQTGGANVNVENATFTVELSDGSVFTVATGTCQ